MIERATWATQRLCALTATGILAKIVHGPPHSPTIRRLFACAAAVATGPPAQCRLLHDVSEIPSRRCMRVQFSSSTLLAVAMCSLAGCSDPVTGPGTAPHFSTVGAVGPLQSWGDNGIGQVSATPAGDFIAASAGGGHSVAIRSDGTLVSWGYNAD